MNSHKTASWILLGACAVVVWNSLYLSARRSPPVATTTPIALSSFATTRRNHTILLPASKVSAPILMQNTTIVNESRCAICMFGLPRAFASLVLPSMKTNVIPINPYCDYFVHYYNQTFEAAGRSGKGGTIRVEEIHLLKEAVRAQNPHAVVHIVAQDPADFERQRATILTKISQPPYKPAEFDVPTTQNIIKMWNSIESAWEAMEEHGRLHNFEYSRVAMIRSDVLFATPLDVWEISDNRNDVDNQVAVVPAFASWPVNDRLIYGPRVAVREWAARRFELLEAHVQWTKRHKRGFGIHSEVFVAHRVLPNIRQLGFQVLEHDQLCFMRARPDETIWLNDCDAGNDPNVAEKAFGGQDCRTVVEMALNRTCVPATKGWIESTKTVTLLCKA